LADEYFGLHAEANFRDMELLVGGDAVQALSRSFDAYWNDRWSVPIGALVETQSFAEREPLSSAVATEAANDEYLREIPLQMSESAAQRLEHWQTLIADAVDGPTVLYVDAPAVLTNKQPLDSSGGSNIADEIGALFDGATEDLLVVSAYLIPTPALEDAILRAVARGVRVRILTNSLKSNNHLAAHSAYRKHIVSLLAGGVELYELRFDARDRSRYMTVPIENKTLALHAKVLVIDHEGVFIGSANLDPRSLRSNTEMGLLVASQQLNAQVRSSFALDFEPANAWRLQLDADSNVQWVANDTLLTSQPNASFMQLIEDWFFEHLPVENEM
jgi:putative cardiolipin synthase